MDAVGSSFVAWCDSDADTPFAVKVVWKISLVLSPI
jgi:hypothetical protein